MPLSTPSAPAVMSFAYNGQSATNPAAAAAPNPGFGANGIFIESVVFTYNVSGTGNWDLRLTKEDSGGATTVLGSVTGITTTTRTSQRVSVNATVSSTDKAFFVDVVENSGTGTLLNTAVINFRYL